MCTNYLNMSTTGDICTTSYDYFFILFELFADVSAVRYSVLTQARV